MLSNNTAIQSPPSGGLYDYQTFKAGSGGFPALMGSFTDPVFGAVDPTGSVVTRYTNTHPSDQLGQDFYGHHWANCDGTRFFWQDAGGYGVKSTADGSTVRASVPVNGDSSWSPTDPDKFTYTSGAVLREYTVSAGTSVAIHTFPNTLLAVGQSHDCVDRTGRYHFLRFNDGTVTSGRVYDRVEDAIYTGPTIGDPGSGYYHMSADGKYAITVFGGLFTAYPLDHAGNSVGTGFQFWNEGSGDHGGFCSASDGKTYMLRLDNTVDGFTYVVEVKDETGRTTAQRRTDNVVVLNNEWIFSFHCSGVGKGALQDWIFLNIEYPPDTFDHSIAGWHKYSAECLAINVLTHEQRRFCHHRSRSTDVKYDYQPKITCSWDGSVILWESNFNYNNGGANGYADAWGIANPLGAAPDVSPPSPNVPRSGMKIWSHAR